MNNIYQTALDVQSACNASGVIRSLATITETIWAEARLKNEGTQYVNTHPVVILFLNQLAWLSTGDCLSPSKVYEAMQICEERAQLTSAE